MGSRGSIARRCALALALAAGLAGAARAHDTWLNPPREPAARQPRLELSTGNRFPVRESGLPADGIVAGRCIDSAGGELGFQPRRSRPDALELQAQPAPKGRALAACWVRSRVFQVDITPELVDVYLQEIQPPPAVVQAWQQQRAEGLPWHEAYSKQARIELAPTAGADWAAARRPTGQGLELLPLGSEAVRAGQDLALRVLLDGRPAPGQSVEFVSERSALGIWRRADAQGLVRAPLPFKGLWLARATHLVPPAPGEAAWRSHFSTLAVQAQ